MSNATAPKQLPEPILVRQINLGIAAGPGEYGDGHILAGEDASKAFDSNTTTKHLNIAGSKSGIEIVFDDKTKLTNFSITTAAKDPDYTNLLVTLPGEERTERDPLSYSLYGYTTDGWQELSSGGLNPPTTRQSRSPEIQLANTGSHFQALGKRLPMGCRSQTST
jgi:hypothetical protein